MGLILLMFIIDLGGTPKEDRIGFRYWDHPGPMNTYLEPGALGRFLVSDVSEACLETFGSR